MWGLFRTKKALQDESAKESNEIESQKLSRSQFEEVMQKLIKKMLIAEQSLINIYSINERDEVMADTFKEMMSTLEGLLTIIEQLRQQYETKLHQISDLERLKQKLTNHHNIVSALQDSHSQHISQIFNQKSQQLKEMQDKLLVLMEEKQSANGQIKNLIQQLNQKNSIIQQFEKRIDFLQSERKIYIVENQKLHERNNQILEVIGQKETRKIVDLNNLKLQQVFYYVRFRQKINQFLGIRDLINLKMTNKFFKFIIQREQSSLIYRNIKSFANKKQKDALKVVANYEKVFELFPSENIKFNALKYLHFKIKPGAYILPFLNQDYEQEQEEKHEQTQKIKNDSSKFSLWKNIFKNDKKQQSNQKFNLNQLKNEEAFKKISKKIQVFFQNLFNFKHPDDLLYFSENMEKQLQELKYNLNDHKQTKLTLTSWSAQLCCLSKFLYLQINELYNLLLVTFGQLISKNRQSISLSEEIQYLRGNENILRDLIQNVSADKCRAQKKSIQIQNQVIKNQLQKQILNNNLNKLISDFKELKEKYQLCSRQNLSISKLLEKQNEQKKIIDQNLLKIKEELATLDISTKKRRQSFGSVMSEDGMKFD